MKNKKSLIIGFIALNLCIYIAFIYTDIKCLNKYSIPLKYSAIVICFLMTLFINKDGYGAKDTMLLQLARFFTIIADFFLVIKDNFILGVAFFCFVQFTYILRHSANLRIKNITLINILGAYLFLLLIFSNFKPKFINEGLLILVITYGTLLIISVTIALKIIKTKFYPKTTAYLIALGMILFFMCDINVGLYVVLENLSINEKLIEYQTLVGILIWFFYLPSQVLLTLSGFRIERKI